MDTKTVLLVDDDKNISEMYKSALESAGLEVITADNGDHGIKLALEKHPTLILMDISMPVLSGLEAAKKIRNDIWGRDAKIIFLTNMSDAFDVATGIALKPEDYIIKANASVKEVVNRVRTALY